MKNISVVAAVVLLTSFLIRAEEWNPEQVTFDPTVKEIVFQGAKRPGDPTPFYKEGFSVLSFTSIEAKMDPNLGAMIWFDLIVPFVPGQTGPHEGDSLYLSIPQAQDLIAKLEAALTHVDEEKDFGSIFPDGESAQWSVMTDPRDSSLPIVLEMVENEERDRYHFGINPSKKLIDTLRKVSQMASELGP